MADYRVIEQRLSQDLNLKRRPVAIAFRDTAPPAVAKFAGTEPSGCSFWRIAASGKTFYTVPADHHNCPIGSFTHGIALPKERAGELDQVLALMSGIGYIRIEEVSKIARLPRAPGVVIYAPLADSPLEPDVVIFSGQPGRLMLLQEAALRAGIDAQVPLFGRPTCMALPAAISSGIIASSACIGNRVYTDLGEDELCVTVPGKDMARIAEATRTVVAANAELLAYHRARRQSLSSE